MSSEIKGTSSHLLPQYKCQCSSEMAADATRSHC